MLIFKFKHEPEFQNYLIDKGEEHFGFKIIGQEVPITIVNYKDLKRLKELEPTKKTDKLWADLVGMDSEYIYIIEVKSYDMNYRDFEKFKMAVNNLKCHKKVIGIVVSTFISSKMKEVIQGEENMRIKIIEDAVLDRSLAHRLHDTKRKIKGLPIELTGALILGQCNIDVKCSKSCIIRDEHTVVFRFRFKNNFGINVMYKRHSGFWEPLLGLNYAILKYYKKTDLDPIQGYVNTKPYKLMDIFNYLKSVSSLESYDVITKKIEDISNKCGDRRYHLITKL
ncbi:hypothetical protein [Clostridium sp. DJ247]|uniref:hypothetical protein n=1 Tax=Clostridium sp. DJ247 TaxID=2726188 RepID=UPI00162511E4|nr:hypothetical protein [Clostridium sp. DJ247]MBC2580829.1 hypothetical protein [Clostridium sp. DJ247]